VALLAASSYAGRYAPQYPAPPFAPLEQRRLLLAPPIVDASHFVPPAIVFANEAGLPEPQFGASAVALAPGGPNVLA